MRYSGHEEERSRRIGYGGEKTKRKVFEKVEEKSPKKIIEYVDR